MKISDFDQMIVRKLKLKVSPGSYFVYDHRGCTAGSGLTIREGRALKNKIKGTLYAVFESPVNMRTCEVLD